ncbi:MAG: AtpZ/AtpI family protein [Candidatus Margulisbacteria bacterium]|jgi:hypothetical protein|nr:AtpZ/AtpI family protein [Candidatus Margulisiibacteriota bacterium]
MNRADRQFLNWAFESAVVVGAAALAGKWLDAKFETGANILALLLLLGFLLEGYSLYKIIKGATPKK